MIFIGGISQGRINFDFFRQTMVCKKCGRFSSISVFMVYSYFSFFFDDGSVCKVFTRFLISFETLKFL